tara:strand:- start:18531 stop:18962 length:432 start_codon:yes stop_codon:yes gene_type:complete
MAGQPRNLDNPEQLWEHFQGYVKYEKDNPFTRRDYVGKDGRAEDTDLLAPLTMEGFKTYLWDIGVGCIDRYLKNSNEAFNEYVPIFTRIKDKIFSHNFKGASGNLMKENLISRQLGLKEQTENINVNKEVPLFPDVQTDDSSQ